MIALFVVGFSLGVSAKEIALHIFLPYTVDISRGIGREGAAIFRKLMIVGQMTLLGFVFLRYAARSKTSRVCASVVGILIALAYFLAVALSYIVPRLH